MKKNKAMRAAGGLFVATMLSTSIISGTYAKYVTRDNAADSARVAKFGAVVAASGSLFSKNYYGAEQTNGNQPAADNTADTTSTTLTVQSSTVDKVIAPGTKSDQTNPMKISVSGSPEVDVLVKFTLGSDNKDVFLAAKNNLPDMTTGDKTDTFDNTAKYNPIVYKLSGAILNDSRFSTAIAGTGANTTNLDTDGYVTGSLDQISDVLNKLNGTDGNGVYVNANTNLATVIGDLTISWEWDFDDSAAGTYDKQDTLLGDLAAKTTLAPDTTLVEDTDYSLNANFSLSVSVTQVD